jgi:hypothetical protein
MDFPENAAVVLKKAGLWTINEYIRRRRRTVKKYALGVRRETRGEEEMARNREERAFTLQLAG